MAVCTFPSNKTLLQSVCLSHSSFTRLKDLSSETPAGYSNSQTAVLAGREEHRRRRDKLSVGQRALDL
jgi:hypothetical protein